MSLKGSKIAIVGAGVAGLTALKELREAGADVTAFERRQDVGGLWSWTEDTSITAALRETQICNSKYFMALSDFPMGRDYPAQISAPEMGKYLSDYANHFDLRKHIRFGESITRLERDEPKRKWLLHIADQNASPYSFDKIVWATGQFIKPKPISFPNQDQFAGRIMHSQDVRNLKDLEGMNVVVLGMGNTAVDIATGLVPYAKQVYLCHRRGANIMCRTDADGLPADLIQSSIANICVWWLEQNFPKLAGKLLDFVFDSNFKKKYGFNDPAWGFTNHATIGDGVHTIMCNDSLIPHVKAGKVFSKSAIRSIAGPRAIELESGERIEDIDVVITCTGYSSDLGMLSEAVTYSEPATPSAPPMATPNLYMNIFPPKYADSVAVVSFTHVNAAQPPARELIAMALAQIWSGNSSLPPLAEMNKWIKAHDSWRRPRIQKEPNLHPGDVVTGPWIYFLHDKAGTGLYEHIGWSGKAWNLWWRDRELYNAIVYGPATSSANRLFETGKRSTWDGARAAILDIVKEVEELKTAKKNG